MIERSAKLAIYMEGAIKGVGGKMGFGILRYSPNPVVCVVDSQSAGEDLTRLVGSPRSAPIVSTIDEVVAMGAEVLVLGIAPPGGLIPSDWWPVIQEAVVKGLSIVNGLHDLVGPHFPEMASEPGLRPFVWDIRVEPKGLQPGTAKAALREVQRVLMIGTDMNIGKMTAGLEIQRVARERSIAAEFVATGQIGITITGTGVPLDAIRVDFASGAIEREVLAAADLGADTIIVEGQGSLIHPGSTANLPLLRGSCPTHLVLCHRANQEHLSYFPDIKIPPLDEFVEMYRNLAAACGTFPQPMLAAVALNTFHLKSDAQAMDACEQIERHLGVPCVDPVRHGASAIVDALGF